jgi:hypothetical protein
MALRITQKSKLWQLENGETQDPPETTVKQAA